MADFHSAPGVPGPCPECNDWVGIVEVGHWQEYRPRYRVMCMNPECHYRTRYVLKPTTAWRAHERNVTRGLEAYYQERVAAMKESKA